MSIGEYGYYAWIGAFFILGIIFALGAYIAAWFLRPIVKQTGMKVEPYECGEETIGPTWIQFNARYYLWALIFVIFDVEVLFVVPWAVVYSTFHPISVAFFEMAVFLFILIIGLLYAWKKRALEWI
jgi:NADH-quinone oxidoreductase subunit A